MQGGAGSGWEGGSGLVIPLGQPKKKKNKLDGQGESQQSPVGAAGNLKGCTLLRRHKEAWTLGADRGKRKRLGAVK